MNAVNNLVGDCNTNSVNESDVGECPAASHSEGVRDMLTNNAGAIGWLALSFEYAIKHSIILRIMVATFLLALGIMIAFFGYKLKDIEFWFEGLLAGMVVWTTIIAIIVCWFGVCRGGFIGSCDPTWIFVVIMVLS